MRVALLGAPAGEATVTLWLPLARKFDSEAELASATLAVLERHFVIEREVEGVHCSGQPLRLDAALCPRDRAGWRDAAPAFGVEFKNPDRLDSMRDFTSWAAQSVDYTHTQWHGYGRLTVFTCPPISARLDEASGRWAARFLGQMNVGELGWTLHGWALQLCGEAIWSQHKGVHRSWSLIPKAGSR